MPKQRNPNSAFTINPGRPRKEEPIGPATVIKDGVERSFWEPAVQPPEGFTEAARNRNFRANTASRPFGIDVR